MTTSTETHQCSSCGDPVAARRKSKTGTHWCSKPECVAAKQRFYYRHRSTAEQERLAKRQTQIDRFDLVAHVIQGRPRTPCETCGREDAILGFAHPTPDWTAPCDGLGNRASQAGIDWIELIWPRSTDG